MKQTADEMIRGGTTIRPQNQTGATVNGEAIDVKDMGEVLVHLTIGAFTSGTLDVRMQESDDGVSGFTDIQDSQTVPVKAEFTQKGTGDANKEFVGRIDVSGTKNFIRAVGAGLSTPNFDYAVVVEALTNKEAPIAQVNPSEFSLFETV